MLMHGPWKGTQYLRKIQKALSQRDSLLMNNSTDFKGKDLELLPFGFSGRDCPTIISR